MEMIDKEPKVLVVGDLIIDEYVYGSSSRLSPEAPVPVVVESRRLLAQGGAGNVVENLKALGAETRFWHGEKSSHKLRIISGHQQIVRLDNDNCEQAPTPGFIGDWVRWADAVVISDYDKGVVTPHIIQSVNRFCKTWGKPLLVDPYKYKCHYGDAVTLIKPNRQEAQSVAATEIRDLASLQVAGEIYLELSKADNVVITLGEDGAALFERKKKGQLPYLSKSPRPQQVFDVTGAGDTAIATLAFVWASAQQGHFSKQSAVDWATRAASIVVGKLGTATVSAAELFGPFPPQLLPDALAMDSDYAINEQEPFP